MQLVPRSRAIGFVCLTLVPLTAASCGEPDAADVQTDLGAATACTVPSFVGGNPHADGWASQNGGTVGGGAAAPKVVTTLSAFNSAAAGTTPAVIYVSGKLGQGTATIGSNKTIVGCSGTNATLSGHVELKTSKNVIIRNMHIVGYNCAPPDVDTSSGGQCQDGQDAVTVEKESKNIWFDHDAISDGSDGNLDIVHGSDFITVSYTKFFYSTKRSDPNDTGAKGHRFSNLVGGSDSNGSEDTGHLNITWHHDWWGQFVVERQPRIRFGKNHLYNNLWTSAGDDYCIGAGVSSNTLDEENAFIGVKNPINSTSYSNSATVVVSRNNLYSGISGSTANRGSSAFSPPYSYAPEAAGSVQADVQSKAGPK